MHDTKWKVQYFGCFLFPSIVTFVTTCFDHHSCSTVCHSMVQWPHITHNTSLHNLAQRECGRSPTHLPFTSPQAGLLQEWCKCQGYSQPVQHPSTQDSQSAAIFSEMLLWIQQQSGDIVPMVPLSQLVAIDGNTQLSINCGHDCGIWSHSCCWARWCTAD